MKESHEEFIHLKNASHGLQLIEEELREGERAIKIIKTGSLESAEHAIEELKRKVFWKLPALHLKKIIQLLEKKQKKVQKIQKKIEKTIDAYLKIRTDKNKDRLERKVNRHFYALRLYVPFDSPLFLPLLEKRKKLREKHWSRTPVIFKRH